MKLQEVKSPKPIAIYPGRFQPMGSHHFKAYQNLVKKFGAKNVYIATSGVTGPKSPFTFAEKKKIIQAYGIPSNRIIKVRDPYKAVEITSKLSEDTPVVFGFGAKDAGRLTSGKYFKDYKEGKKLYTLEDKQTLMRSVDPEIVARIAQQILDVIPIEEWEKKNQN